jgi:hypothetical protein
MARMIDGFRTDKKTVDENKTGMLAEKSGRKHRVVGKQKQGSND